MKKRLFSLCMASVLMLGLASNASAADYTFSTDPSPQYYGSTFYEDLYEAEYNYGGRNQIDYDIPEVRYGLSQQFLETSLNNPYLGSSIQYGIASSGNTSMVYPESDFSNSSIISGGGLIDVIYRPSYTVADTSVEELYLVCQDRVMATVESPTSIDEFESYIRLLGDCLAVYESQDLLTRQQELSDELVIFIEVSEIIQTATDLYDTEQYEESFVTLALGMEEYPNEERLATTLVDYHDHYIISITKEAVALCEEEEYKDALAVVEQAIEEYDCEEFRLLQESIKEQKSFFYRFKNDMVEKFTVMAQGWESEEFDVKQAATSTGAYIVKSGEKIVLGDYSEEDVTILTFGGNIIASLANVDFLFDLRDLTYDVIHWGEGECFAVYLATDVIALLPVIGVVKYFDHFKTVADGVKSADLVDSVADIGKGTANAAEVADAVKDAAKTGESIIETVDSAKNAARIGEAAKDVATDISKTYRLIPTINSKLLGSKHPETGIEFVLKKLKYSDGQMIQGVFPVFSSFADIDLPKDLYKAKFPDQQKYCIEQLQKKTKPIFGKYRKNFTEDQLDDIANGILPEGFTWHHNEKEGLMQLVDTATHDATGHTGGMSLWGAGY